ncbi:Rho GTPase-activating protein 36, partial [Eschrichtius robustus]|nr:Rho GTPase-activating protein 36 [Eschrichtius robustus]
MWGGKGAVSVDSLAELEDGALLLQTLQLSKTSFPIGQRLLGSKRKMSLNPIAKQIPQVVEACCSFIEKHGLSTVGIFTLEYSEQRVHKLREEFDQGLDVVLDDSQNVHDVAALLKEFFRDMKDSLLPDDLYMSFLLTATLKPQDQLSALQLLVYLMPPCHSDTLERLLKVLHKITENCEDSIGIDGQLKDLANTFEEDEITNMAPEPEDVSILNTIPDPQPDLAVNLEEIMKVEAVPMPSNLDSKEVLSPRTIQFHKEDAAVTFPVDIAFLKSKSQPGQVMDYRSFSESLKTDTCFLPSMKFCSSEEPAVPPGTARSHDDDEGAGKPPILEQDRPLLRVPWEKEAKTGVGYFFP